MNTTRMLIGNLIESTNRIAPLKHPHLIVQQRRFLSCSHVRNSTTNEVKGDGEREGGALDGIRVIDFSGALAGPSCAMYLADLGADVIKIERPLTGDDSRGWGPPFLENKKNCQEWSELRPESAYFQAINRNKRSLTLNIKDEKAQEIIRRLVKNADVLLENTTTGKMAKLGLGYEQLSKINPRLIYASITGYGQTGPYAKHPGYDAIISAEAGMVYSTGDPNGRPVRPGVSITDLFAGFNAFGAILASIIKRNHTGKGCYVDVSMFDSQAAVMSTVASNWLNAGKEAKRLGTAHASVVPYQAFETSDGDIMLACGTDRQFGILAKVFGKDEWAQDPRYVTNAQRIVNKQELLAEIAQIFKSKSTEFWMSALNGSGVPHGSINNMEKVFKHPSGIARNLVSEVEHSRSGKVKFVGPAVMYDGKRAPVRLAPPVLGEHTDEILSRELGLSGEEIQKLRSQQVV